MFWAITWAHAAPQILSVEVAQTVVMPEFDGVVGPVAAGRDLAVRIRSAEVTSVSLTAQETVFERPATGDDTVIVPWQEGLKELVVTAGPLNRRLQLDVRAVPPLEIMVVPVLYKGDYAKRLPDLDAGRLTRWANHWMNMVPLPHVAMRLHPDPMPFDGDLARPRGWGSLLVGLAELRQTLDLPDHVLLVGVVKPGRSMGSYRGQDMGRGAYPHHGPAFRVAATVAFEDEALAAETLAHELGHALGLQHSPCATEDQLDWEYPPDGSLGSPGFDRSRNQWLPADSTWDLMGYCEPRWASPHTVEGSLAGARALHSLGGRRISGRVVAPQDGTNVNLHKAQVCIEKVCTTTDAQGWFTLTAPHRQQGELVLRGHGLLPTTIGVFGSANVYLEEIQMLWDQPLPQNQGRLRVRAIDFASGEQTMLLDGAREAGLAVVPLSGEWWCPPGQGMGLVEDGAVSTKVSAGAVTEVWVTCRM